MTETTKLIGFETLNIKDWDSEKRSMVGGTLQQTYEWKQQFIHNMCFVCYGDIRDEDRDFLPYIASLSNEGRDKLLRILSSIE